MNGGVPDQFSSSSYAVIVFIIIINSVTCPFTIAFNLLVLIAVKTKARPQHMSKIAIACLTTADLMVGVVVQPLAIPLSISILQGETSSEACSIQAASFFLGNFLLFSSLLHLVLISVDRYFAITHPYTYGDIVTRFRILVASASAWIIAFITQINMFINPSLTISFKKPLVIASIVGIILCHVTIYRESRRHEQQMAVL